ncbi:hypothetical protein [Xenorhabdus thuongxuanensis]|uniref:Uncharacterized protein n=1 Tax=Xenorhabdus thuongxuanensis TaxID=1873484 RepID=A0A1Q5U2M7_9GAMM|nr:hypothetical protein [Xenorhabdus thuongxuanensis]OKP06740.1 hypothetical protein Xentx_01866 [Xenorhabdus thuongxuanensis]
MQKFVKNIRLLINAINSVTPMGVAIVSLSVAVLALLLEIAKVFS